MWYRVELHKDGSVADCKLVESCGTDGRSVYYVDAAGAAEAVKAACEAWRVRKRAVVAAYMAAQTAAGKCRRCGKPRGNDGTSTVCRQCADVDSARVARYRAAIAEGTYVPPVVIDPREARAKDAASRGAAHAFARSGGHTYTTALEAFDRMKPPAFRAWLLRQIAAAAAKRESEYTATLLRYRIRFQSPEAPQVGTQGPKRKARAK